MEPVVRVGDTVRRASGPWSDAVHAFLRACETAGIAETPRSLGFDEQGREMLTYLDGDVLTAHPDTMWSLTTLKASARLLRRIHDAGARLVSKRLAWRSPVHDPVEVICHNDFAPYNMLTKGGGLSGVIDFDMASPGPRIWDVAYLAYRLVPWAADSVTYNPRLHGSREERLSVLIATYGIDCSPQSVRATAVARLIELAAFTEFRATETGRSDLVQHAAMYRGDAERLRATKGNTC